MKTRYIKKDGDDWYRMIIKTFLPLLFLFFPLLMTLMSSSCSPGSKSVEHKQKFIHNVNGWVKSERAYIVQGSHFRNGTVLLASSALVKFCVVVGKDDLEPVSVSFDSAGGNLMFYSEHRNLRVYEFGVNESGDVLIEQLDSVFRFSEHTVEDQFDDVVMLRKISFVSDPILMIKAFSSAPRILDRNVSSAKFTREGDIVLTKPYRGKTLLESMSLSGDTAVNAVDTLDGNKSLVGVSYAGNLVIRDEKAMFLYKRATRTLQKLTQESGSTPFFSAKKSTLYFISGNYERLDSVFVDE